MAAASEIRKRAIIDFRCRPNTFAYLKILESPMFQAVIRKVGAMPTGTPDIDGWVEIIKQHGIDKVVFTGRESEKTAEFDVTNEYVAEVASKHPDTVIGFAGLNPMNGVRSVKSVDYVTKELGLRGISIDPFGLGARANDARIYPVYAKCAENGIPVVITCGPLPFRGPRIDHGYVRWIDDVAEYFPELTIIISHGGWPWVTETAALAFRHDNVYIDTSFYSHLPGGEMIAQAANTIIPDKVLFASGFPIVPIEAAVDRIQRLPFTDEALEGVMYGNAEKLLKKHGCI